MQPTVVGPISELSGSVRVQGQVPGSKVTIETGARTVAVGVATSGDQRFPLLAGVTLSHTEKLYAVQQLGGDSSDVPAGDQAMPVAPQPTSAAGFGPVSVATHLYACGRFVWINGALPGAEVTLLDGATVLGTGQADEGTARFGLTNAIPSGSWIVAHQGSPGIGQGPDVGSHPDDLPGNAGTHLPAPVITQPVRGCDASVHITGVFDGALVTVQRGSGTVDTAGFDRGDLHFVLSKPVEEDDTLTVTQEVDGRCERRTTVSAPITVGKATPVAPPAVLSPLCAGATTVRVSNLRPGALVHLAANQQTYDGACPPDQTWLDCRIPALTTDPVSATQELCGIVSAPAKAVTPDSHPANVPAPTIVTPVISCTGVVSVTNAHRGAVLQIFAQTPAGAVPISAQVFTAATNAVVAVAPLLVEGHRVFVRQWACSDTSADSHQEPVLPHGDPSPVTVLAPLTDGERTVATRGATPGGVVEVYAVNHTGGSPEFLGSATASPLHLVTVVGLKRALVLRDGIFAIDRLCGRSSEPQGTVIVVPRATFGPRPFYVFGHNPNTVKDATECVKDGATGLEPDLQVYEDDTNKLCISHGTGESSAPSLVDYLDGLHAIASKHPGLSLIVFDCKEESISADHGFELLTAVREHLTFDNDITVIISVGKIAHGAMFDRIIDLLGPREGIMIDAEDDPGAVTNYFAARGVTNHGYGNGISFMNFILGPYYRYTLEAACGIRAQAGRPRFVYVWTVNVHDELREYIRIGVDGAITDDVKDLVAIAAESEFASTIRPAIRSDNPLRPGNFAYGLHMHTADKWMAGTDANVTFTITGSLGSASKTVNTELINRMESDDWNWVTIPSDDLGTLVSMTVQRDDDGNGPDWFLDSIDVRSKRYGTHARADYFRWIDSTSPFTVPLV